MRGDNKKVMLITAESHEHVAYYAIEYVRSFFIPLLVR